MIEHGRANALMSEVPDPFRPPQRRHRLIEDTNEEQFGKALPEKVIRQLDQHLSPVGPDGATGSMSAADLRAMHQTIYQILRDTGRRPGEIVSLKIGCVEVIDGQHNLVYDNHKAARTAPPPAHHHPDRRNHHGLAASPRTAAHRARDPASGCSPPRCCAPARPAVT